MAMSNEDAATVAGIVLIVLDILTVAGRFYSRWFTKAGLRWDDWTILIALLTGLIPGILTIYGTSSMFTLCLPFFFYYLFPTYSIGSDHGPLNIYTPET